MQKAASFVQDQDIRRKSGRRRRSSRTSSASCTTSDVRQKLHETYLKRVAIPLEEDHKSACELLRTECGNAFFHYLADRIEDKQKFIREPGARKYRKIRSKIKLSIPETVLRRSGCFCLLYTNEKTSCVELKVGMSRKTLWKQFSGYACWESGPAAVLKRQDNWNAGIAEGVGVDELAPSLGCDAEGSPLPGKPRWEEGTVLQRFVASKGPSSALYRVMWRSATAQSAQLPSSKVWKLSSLVPSPDRPLVETRSCKLCSVQDVSGRKFVEGAVDVASGFAQSLGAALRPGGRRIRVTEVVLDLVLSRDAGWTALQVKGIKCVGCSSACTGAARRTLGGTVAMPPSERCMGDYCGKLSSRETQFSGAGEFSETPAGPRRVVSVPPFGVGGRGRGRGGDLGGDLVLCGGPEEAGALFKIPYKLIHNDRGGMYAKSDTAVQWMFRAARLDGVDSDAVDCSEKWEEFKQFDAVMIEDAFQKGSKYYQLREGISISFAEEVMECEGVGPHNNAAYQIRRHPPFVTQQYIVDRGGPLGPTTARRGREGKRLYDMVSVCRDCYRVYLCKEHVKLQGMLRD